MANIETEIHADEATRNNKLPKKETLRYPHFNFLIAMHFFTNKLGRHTYGQVL